MMGDQEYPSFYIASTADGGHSFQYNYVDELDAHCCVSYGYDTVHTFASVAAHIDDNISSRLLFRWSIVLESHLSTIINDAIKDAYIPTKYIIPGLVADNNLRWVGFVPPDMFREGYRNHLKLEELCEYNDELLRFRKRLCEAILSHNLYQSYALYEDAEYRFLYFKEIRNNREKLTAAYHKFIAAADVVHAEVLTRDCIDMAIGCHFLHHPDLYFELICFSILKGQVCE